MIFDHLCSEGWKLRWFSFCQSGRELWRVDAAREGQFYVVQAEDFAIAFAELKRLCTAAGQPSLCTVR